MASQTLNDLPDYLRRAVYLGQVISCSFSISYSEAEDAWYASMDGPSKDEHWEVKHTHTARVACDDLVDGILDSVLPSGKTYRQAYADWFPEKVST